MGINCFVVQNGKLLLGKRKNVYGAGTWGLPGGHLEIGEAMKDAAARELIEETGLTAKDFEFSDIVNDRSASQHYIQIGFIAQGIIGKPELKEPDRCEEWEWFKFDELPQDLFPPHIKQIENFIKKLNFVDA
ncbi:MAG: NUDIX domain-containing protein [Candidatus Pacebacteria bacterium]|nr:NUDIX domain-containing protein [Candidatus Paceibacterota bacterium]